MTDGLELRSVKMTRSTFIKFFLGTLAAVSFLGSLVLTFLALLIPLRPYDWGPPDGLSLQTDDDCACFIFVSCFLSTFLLGISLISLKCAKIGISKKMATKIVYMFWIVVTLARMFYVLPYYHG